MNLTDATKVATDLMVMHGLYRMGWGFRWGNAVKQYGSCNYRTKVIRVSKPMMELNPDQFVDTVLHEIAHALAGPGAGHGPEWRRVAKQIGATPEAKAEGNIPDGRYQAVCANCGHKYHRHRMTKGIKACGKCCNKYNGGAFTYRYALNYIDTKEAVRA